MSKNEHGPSLAKQEGDGGGGGSFAKAAETLSPESMTVGLGQKLLGEPLTNTIHKDFIGTVLKDIAIGIVSGGGKPVKGGGGGGGGGKEHH